MPGHNIFKFHLSQSDHIYELGERRMSAGFFAKTWEEDSGAARRFGPGCCLGSFAGPRQGCGISRMSEQASRPAASGSRSPEN
jgi:hypothetical protein